MKIEPKTPRRRRSDGERSRRTILEASARLATVEGLRGSSIGGLAEHIGMSKSGLYAHLGSDGALGQLVGLCEQFLRYVDSGKRARHGIRQRVALVAPGEPA